MITLIRFSFRTGRVVVGATGAKVVARRRKNGLILIASDMIEKKAGAIRRWAEGAGVPVYAPLIASDLADAAGRARCEVVYIYDPGLSRSIGNELGGIV